MKLVEKFESELIPNTKKILEQEENILFDLKLVEAVYGDKNGIQSIICKQQQSIYVLKMRLKEYQNFVNKMSK